MTYSITLLGRTLAIICMYNNLDPEQSGQIYEIEPSPHLYEKCPNQCILPMTHNVDVQKTENIPLVVVNLSSDEIYLLKGETMGFMQNQLLDVSEIMTETSTEPSHVIIEDDDKGVLYEQKEEDVNNENIEKKFITSPADIEVHRKVELQDADVTEAQ